MGDEGFLITAGFVIGFIIMAIVYLTTATPNNVWRVQAIDRGYARYCPHNGNFAWIGECDEQ